MQSQIDSDTDEHSCFDSIKQRVMGCCYSLCHKDTHTEETLINERTVLLSVPEETPPSRAILPTPATRKPDEQLPEETPPSRAILPTPATRKPDEQSALSRILQEAATNVIDVGALGPHTLETHEYSDRVRAYQARLAATSTKPVTLTTPCLLKDIPQAQKITVLSASPVDMKDVELIQNAVKKASAAMSELRVEHREDLVVPFKIP